MLKERVKAEGHMRKRKLLAVLLSTVLLTQTVIYAAAEQETGNAGETEQLQEFEQKSMDGEMTEAEDPAGGLTGGYLPSDLDYNTPVYYGSSRARRAAAAIPASYQSDVNALRSTYPAVRDQNPYGTCWAFSTMGLAEFDLINKGVLARETDLSELQLAYFTYNFVQDPLGGTAGDRARYYNENTATSYLDYGGNYAMAVRRLSQWIGAVKESDVPYSLAKSTLTDGLGDSYAYQYDAAHLENAKWSSVTGEKLIGHSLSMKGDIEINYYMELPEELLEDKTAVLEFTRPDGTVKSIGVNEAEKTSSGYKISCPVAAKEMICQRAR